MDLELVMTTIQRIRRLMRKLARKRHAKVLQRYFKTGPGEYGEGDQFLGIRVPQLRKLALEYAGVKWRDIETLLQSPVHEERMLALLILVRRYQQGNAIEQKRIYRLYFQSTQFINNWDLVDVSAEHIVGAFLFGRDKEPLSRLAESADIWERRIAIMSTFYFIRQKRYSETLRLARLLLSDEEDLVHKAVGWMLREVGKRDLRAEEKFLRQHCTEMPRTMLRYAVERFPEPKRKRYLKE